MRRQGFLKRLNKEAALQLVTPSDEMKSAYLKKAESNLCLLYTSDAADE